MGHEVAPWRAVPRRVGLRDPLYNRFVILGHDNKELGTGLANKIKEESELK